MPKTTGEPGKKHRDDHAIPPKLPYEALRGLVLDRDPLTEHQIREYVESQSHGATVLHLEKMRTEYVSSHRYDAWDVHVDDGRWWVITSPTNLYPQELFPSLDYTLSLHIGLTARVLAREHTSASPVEEARVVGAFRRWEQAYDALARADEAEDFQAVGNHCRMALLEMIAALASMDMVPASQVAPQRDNFLAWLDLIADRVAPGSSADRVRSYLKAVGRDTWQLANWLTHTKNAALHDGRLVVDATLNVIQAVAAAMVRHEFGTPDRCERCGSYRVRELGREEVNGHLQAAVFCDKCGTIALVGANPASSSADPAP